MSTVREILAGKHENGHTVLTVIPQTSVYDAVVMMNENHVGALVVSHPPHDDTDNPLAPQHPQVLGIFTERDLLRRVVGERRDPIKTKVADVMTTDVACCPIDTSIEEARSVMKNHRIRHLPVVDRGSNSDDRFFDADADLDTNTDTDPGSVVGGLVGMISIGDLNAHRVDSQAQTIYCLKEYLYGAMN